MARDIAEYTGRPSEKGPGLYADLGGNIKGGFNAFHTTLAAFGATYKFVESLEDSGIAEIECPDSSSLGRGKLMAALSALGISSDTNALALLDRKGPEIAARLG